MLSTDSEELINMMRRKVNYNYDFNNHVRSHYFDDIVESESSTTWENIVHFQLCSSRKE